MNLHNIPFSPQTDIMCLEPVGRNHALYFLLIGVCGLVQLFICFDVGVGMKTPCLFWSWGCFYEMANRMYYLQDGLDTDMALLPFKPMAMKVLQCSFLSGIRLQKTQPLLEILRPKAILFPEDLREQINFSSSHSFPVFYYAENETLDVPKSRGSVDLEIASNLATQFSWRKLNHDDMDITRLGGQLFIDRGKHQVLSGNKVSDSSRNKPLLQWGFPDVEKLLTALSKMGVKGSVEQCMSDAESGSDEIVHIHEPSKALIEVRATRTVISARDERLASLIFEAIGTLTDGI
ncbi:hypothetical protein SADUNF_Sadunf01G0189000 [Salix dunnii]|uniref:Uncharacterized protein n=1 Tax=Salix dunnii TaxID=1413687 RepID=A0A835ND67_9ROSI|nr:hypothetical protein SADUNF_Sadunf01G0189000 [Salix dunnii]